MTQQNQQQFTECLEAARSWILEVQERVNANDNTQGPRDALKVRLDETKKIYQSKHEGQMKMADAQAAAQILLESDDEELHRSTNTKLKELKSMWDETEQSITHCHSRIEWVWLRWREYLKVYEEFELWLEKQRCYLDVDVEQQVGAKEKLWQVDQQRVVLSDVRAKMAVLERLLEEAAALHCTTQDPSVDPQTQQRLKESYSHIKSRSEERLALLQRISDEHNLYQDYVHNFQAFLLSKTKELNQLMAPEEPTDGKLKTLKALDHSVACEEKTLKHIEVFADGVKANTSPAGAEVVQEEAEELRLGWQRLRQELFEAGEAFGCSLDSQSLDSPKLIPDESNSNSQESPNLDSRNLVGDNLVPDRLNSNNQGSSILDFSSLVPGKLNSKSQQSLNLVPFKLDSHSLDSRNLDSSNLVLNKPDSHSLDSPNPIPYKPDSLNQNSPNLVPEKLVPDKLICNSQDSPKLVPHKLDSHSLDSANLVLYKMDSLNQDSSNLDLYKPDSHSQPNPISYKPDSLNQDSSNMDHHSQDSSTLVLDKLVPDKLNFNSQDSANPVLYKLDTPNLVPHKLDFHSLDYPSPVFHEVDSPNRDLHSMKSQMEYKDRSLQLQQDISRLKVLLQDLDSELDNPQYYSYNYEDQILGRWRTFTDTRKKLEKQEFQVENLKAQYDDLLKRSADSHFLSEEVLALDTDLQSVKSRATRLCSESLTGAKEILQQTLQEYAAWSRRASAVLEESAGIHHFSLSEDPVREIDVLLQDSHNLQKRLRALEQKDELLESVFEPGTARDTRVELSGAVRRQELLCSRMLQEKERMQGLILETRDFHVAYQQLNTRMEAFRKRFEAADSPQTDVFIVGGQLKEIRALQQDLEDFRAHLTALQTLTSSSEDNRRLCDVLVDEWRELKSLAEVRRYEEAVAMSNHEDFLHVKMEKENADERTKKSQLKSKPRSFQKPRLVERVCRVALPLWLLLLALLLLASFLLPFVDDSNSCSLTNNFARSFNVMLRYHGPPPT